MFGVGGGSSALGLIFQAWLLVFGSQARLVTAKVDFGVTAPEPKHSSSGKTLDRS